MTSSIPRAGCDKAPASQSLRWPRLPWGLERIRPSSASLTRQFFGPSSSGFRAHCERRPPLGMEASPSLNRLAETQKVPLLDTRVRAGSAGTLVRNDAGAAIMIVARKLGRAGDLLLPQSPHRIHLAGPTRRQKTGNHCGNHHHGNRHRESQRLTRPYSGH